MYSRSIVSDKIERIQSAQREMHVNQVAYFHHHEQFTQDVISYWDHHCRPDTDAQQSAGGS